MRRTLLPGLVLLALGPALGRAAPPLAEKYLLEGKLADGEKTLQAQLKKEPKDDQARFGLGVVQFLQTFEHLGTSLYKYGLRTEKAFLRPPPELKGLLPQNPSPEKITYADARKIIQTWVDDLVRAEATLAEIKDEDVKLPLHVGLIQIDLLGLNKPISAALLSRRLGNIVPKDKIEKFYIKFDRGDVCWLRGYCHFLAGWGELLLAADEKELFDCTAHLFFEKVDSPHKALQEEDRHLDDFQNPRNFTDAFAFIHLMLRFPVKEPARTKAALAHFEATLTMAKEMWKHILAETGDDHEWIPNPKQTGVLGVKVTKEMIDTWLETVDEAEQVLQGKKLLPYWRGKNKEVGVNLRKVFTEPRTFDLVLWVQGTAATPYLEKGKITRFADGRFQELLTGRFGGFNLIGFGLWFN